MGVSLALAGSLVACTSRPAESVDSILSANELASASTEIVEQNRGLSYPCTPPNRQFKTLDEYLAYRETLGAIDMAWWQEISPGVYRLVTNLRTIDGRPEMATREELMKCYGFSR